MAKQEQVLTLEPKSELYFTGPFTDVVTSCLKLSNPCDRRVCFKVKTTILKNFLVRPNNGFLDPFGSVNITVSLLPLELDYFDNKNKHKLMVQTMFVPEGDVNQKNLWKEVNPKLIMESKLKCVFDIKPTIDEVKQNSSGAPNDLASTSSNPTNAFEKSMVESNSDPIIGIDLGTTYSCVAVVKNGEVKVIENGLGNRTTPSYVSFVEKDKLVGDPAKDLAGLNPENTFFDFKRLIGRRYSDKHIQNDTKLWPFIVLNVDDKPLLRVEIDDDIKQLHPEELSAMVLDHLKEAAEAYLGEKVKRAVITVPAYFNNSQRQATRDAGKIAGLEVVGLLNEPTAAAIAYGFNKTNKEEKVLVFDLGGGTLDVSVLVINKGKIDVKGISGNTHLGGEDFDNRLVNYCASEFEILNPKCEILGNPRALRRIRTQCERSKKALSAVTTHRIVLDALLDGKDLEITVTRKRFEEMCSDLFESIIEPINDALQMSGFSKDQIDEIILIGGSTKIPKVRSLLSTFFEGKKLNMSTNPDESVAFGAAIRAHNWDETDLIVKNITPLTLGVGVRGDRMVQILPRGSKIPSVFDGEFCTAYDNQVSCKFDIFEGERKVASENSLLGKIIFTGIEPRSAGEIRFNIAFKIDLDGILEITAFQKNNKETKNVKVTLDKNLLTKNEIEELIEQANFMKKRDQQELDRIKAREDLIDYINSIKKEGGFKYSKMTDKLNELSEWIRLNPTECQLAFYERKALLTEFYEFAIKQDKSKIRKNSHDNSDKSHSHDRECIICIENLKNTVFDCGHVLMCYSCAQKHIKNERKKRCPQCPVCSQEIKEVKKIYY